MLSKPNTVIMLQVLEWLECNIKVMERIVAPCLTHLQLSTYLQLSSGYTGEDRSQIQQIFPNVQVSYSNKLQYNTYISGPYSDRSSDSDSEMFTMPVVQQQ